MTYFSIQEITFVFQCGPTLTKDSNKDYRCTLSISVISLYFIITSENRRVSHYIITHRNGQYQIGDQTFNDLPEIVEFYKRHFLDTTTLTEPVCAYYFQAFGLMLFTSE